jgi:hypothetical protein
VIERALSRSRLLPAVPERAPIAPWFGLATDVDKAPLTPSPDADRRGRHPHGHVGVGQTLSTGQVNTILARTANACAVPARRAHRVT